MATKKEQQKEMEEKLAENRKALASRIQPITVNNVPFITVKCTRGHEREVYVPSNEFASVYTRCPVCNGVMEQFKWFGVVDMAGLDLSSDDKEESA